jgi:hypothetical protein
VELRGQGGIMWAAYRGNEYLGSFEFGSLDSEGQYEQDDDEVAEAAAEHFSLPEEMFEVV